MSETTLLPRVIVELNLPLPLSANKRLTPIRLGKTTRLVKSKAAKGYKATVHAICLARRVPKFLGPVALSLRVFRPRKAGDVDNYNKLVLDGLEGALYRNDSQVRELYVFLDDSTPWEPHIHLEAWELP